MVLFEQRGHNIYTSNDLKTWTKTGSIDGFHECPELFPLAVDGDPEKVKWIMYGAKGQYHIGAFDGKTFKPETKQQTPMFFGDKCYASQTFNNTEKGPDGQPRRIQVTWQGGRLGQISLPNELTLHRTPLGMRVCQLPAREIENLYIRSATLDGLVLEPGAANPLEKMKGGLYDIDLEACPYTAGATASANFRYEISGAPSLAVAFDARGEPVAANDLDPAIQDGVVTVALGLRSRTVTVAQLTGRIVASD